MLAISLLEPDDVQPTEEEKHKPEWVAAIRAELDGHFKGNRPIGEFVDWETLTQEERKQTIGLTMKYKIKRDINGNPTRHKARLCARGDQEKSIFAKADTFAPTPRVSTVRSCQPPASF